MPLSVKVGNVLLVPNIDWSDKIYYVGTTMDLENLAVYVTIGATLYVKLANLCLKLGFDLFSKTYIF